MSNVKRCGRKWGKERVNKNVQKGNKQREIYKIWEAKERERREEGKRNNKRDRQIEADREREREIDRERQTERDSQRGREREIDPLSSLSDHPTATVQ